MNEHSPLPRPDAEMIQRLGLDAAPQPRGLLSKRVLLPVIALVVLLAAVAAFFLTGGEQPEFVTTPVARTDLIVTVSATGTLQPRERVDIGAEISGRIERVLVDFNDHVRRGQILAELDTDQLRAKLAQSQAALAAARAAVSQSQATLTQARAAASRAQDLFQREAIARQDVERIDADLARAAASLQRSNADVALAAAQVAADQTTLSKAVIRAPIDGIVLNRQVEPGQAVAASFQTPVLFTLASDLTQMELQVDIDEADIAAVRDGLAANFTVDAFPDRRFDAKLIAVHNAPKTQNGVVTYQAVLLVDNASSLLRPGLTATAEIFADRLRNALVVPNGALRFSPPDRQATAQAAAVPAPGVGRLWVLKNGQPERRTVRVGRSNGALTAIVSGPLQQGELVITDMRTGARAPG